MLGLTVRKIIVRKDISQTGQGDDGGVSQEPQSGI
jgi:hypothetical protein